MVSRWILLPITMTLVGWAIRHGRMELKGYAQQLVELVVDEESRVEALQRNITALADNFATLNDTAGAGATTEAISPSTDEAVDGGETRNINTPEEQTTDPESKTDETTSEPDNTLVAELTTVTEDRDKLQSNKGLLEARLLNQDTEIQDLRQKVKELNDQLANKTPDKAPIALPTSRLRSNRTIQKVANISMPESTADEGKKPVQKDEQKGLEQADKTSKQADEDTNITASYTGLNGGDVHEDTQAQERAIMDKHDNGKNTTSLPRSPTVIVKPEEEKKEAVALPPISRPRSNFTIDTIKERQMEPPRAAKDASHAYPYVAETLYHYGEFPVNSIVKSGQAKPYLPNESKKSKKLNAKPYFAKSANKNNDNNLIWPAKNESEAVCFLKTSDKEVSDEHPHNLQQLLRCFSWWKLNPHQRPVLRVERVSEKPFIKDMYDTLVNAFGVRLHVEEGENTTSPAVTVHVPWLQMHRQVEAYVMNSPDAKTFQNQFFQHYNLPNSTHIGGCPTEDSNQNKKQPVIALLNREGTRRNLENHQEIRTALETAGYTVKYQKNFDGLSMVEQVKFMAEVDIVMGPHGAQFVPTLFQPHCGSLVEYLPRAYYAPNYFGSLAALSGKHHFFTYQGGNPTTRKARTIKTFQVPPNVAVEVTHKAVERWHSCCQYGFRKDATS